MVPVREVRRGGGVDEELVDWRRGGLVVAMVFGRDDVRGRADVAGLFSLSLSLSISFSLSRYFC
jgi:hypothetical protein